MLSASNEHSSQELWLKFSQRFSRYAQKNLNNTCDIGGPVVSHIDNLSMWLFSVGEGHMKFSRNLFTEVFSRYVQTT
jgi:hypothetical protein